LSISLSIVSKLTLPGASLIMPSTARAIPVDIRRVDGIVVGDGEQHRDSLSGVLGQSRRDPQRQRLLTGVQRRWHDTVDPRGGGWLDLLATTTRQQLVAPISTAETSSCPATNSIVASDRSARPVANRPWRGRSSSRAELR
jgi:hypothetical protein